jgi:hypothetical protein
MTARLAGQVASMGLPPLRAYDGSVELSIREDAAKIRHVIENFPADRIPKVGDVIQFPCMGLSRVSFLVTEVKHLLVPRPQETIRAVLLLVKKPHQVLIFDLEGTALAIDVAAGRQSYEHIDITKTLKPHGEESA